MSYIQSISIMLVLFVLAVIDLKKKELTVRSLIIGGVVICMATLISKNYSIVYSLIGAVIGILFIGVSKWTKGALGMADAYVIFILGISMGIYQLTVVLFYSMFLAAVVSVILLCLRKCKKKDAIPYLPFLLISYLGVILS